MSLVNTAVQPDVFFEERVDDLSLWPAVAIVLATAVFNIGATYLVTDRMFAAMSSDAQQFSVLAYGSAIVGGLVVTVGIWLLYTVTFHVLATLLYDGEGSFGETLAVTAWGHLPQALGALIALGVTYYVFSVQGVVYPDTADMQAIQQYTQSIQARPVFQWSTAAGILFTLWSGFIWITGVSEAQDIEEQDAFVVVAVPVAISVVWTLYTLL